MGRPWHFWALAASTTVSWTDPRKQSDRPLLSAPGTETCFVVSLGSYSLDS
jgi:hypothetical protein